MKKNSLKRITVKIGTKVLTDGNNMIDKKIISSLVGQVCDLMDKKIEVVIVSSGAVGAGLGLLNVKRKGRSLSELQAIASVGQNHLMDIYNEYFTKRGYVAGQILLTQEDLNDRRRFLNIRYTINTLFKYRAVPLINENDSVSTEEIKCGDNDRLSSLVADLAGSDMLILLTDVEGVYGADGKLVENGADISGDISSFCTGKGSEESTGGMITKLESVRNAVCSGITSVIASGRRENVILDIVNGIDVGTKFESSESSLKARKRWIAYSIKPKGSLTIDDGAEKALTANNKSLLPSGILDVSGKFTDGDVVDVKGSAGRVIARGLSNYSSDEIIKIKGVQTSNIEKVLGYKDYDEVIHRDNMVIL